MTTNSIRSVRHYIESCSDLSECVNESCQYFRDIKALIEFNRTNFDFESATILLELIHDSLPYMRNAMVILIGIVLNELISCLSVVKLRKEVERIFTHLTMYQDGAIILKSSLNSVLRDGCEDKESLEFIQYFCLKSFNPREAENNSNQDPENRRNTQKSSELYLLDFFFTHEVVDDWIKAEADDKLKKALINAISKYKDFRHTSRDQFVKVLPTIMKMLLSNFLNDSIIIILSVLEFLEILLIDSPNYFLDHYKDLFNRLQELMGNTRSQTYLPAIHFAYSLAYHLPYTVTCPILFSRLSNPMDKASLLQVNMQLASLSLLSSRIESVNSIVMRMAIIAAEVLDSSDAFHALCLSGRIREHNNDVSEYFYESATDLLAACLYLAHPQHCKASDFLVEGCEEIVLPFDFYYSLNVNIHLMIQNKVCQRAATMIFPSLHWDTHAARLLSLAISTSATRPKTRKPVTLVNSNNNNAKTNTTTTSTSKTNVVDHRIDLDPNVYLPSWSANKHNNSLSTTFVTDITSEVKIDSNELNNNLLTLDDDHSSNSSNSSRSSFSSPHAPILDVETVGSIVTRSQRLRAANLRRRSIPTIMPVLLETDHDSSLPNHEEKSEVVAVETPAIILQSSQNTTTSTSSLEVVDPLWLLKNKSKQPSTKRLASGRLLRRHSLNLSSNNLSDNIIEDDFDNVPMSGLGLGSGSGSGSVPPTTSATSCSSSLFSLSTTTITSERGQDQGTLSQSFHRGLMKGDRSNVITSAGVGTVTVQSDQDLLSFSDHGDSKSRHNSNNMNTNLDASLLSNSYHAGMNASTMTNNNSPSTSSSFSPLVRGRRSLLVKAASTTSDNIISNDEKATNNIKNKNSADIIPISNISSSSNTSGSNGGMAFDSTQYPLSRDINPSLNPSQELNKVLLELETSLWPEIFQTLTSVRRLGLHHQPILRSSGSLHTIVKGTLKQTENLRSAVCKNALLAVGDLFEGMKKDMDAEVTNLVLILLKRCADSSVFLSETADHAAFQMITHATPSKSLLGLMSGSDHRNSVIRSKVAMLLLHLLNSSKLSDLKGNTSSELNLLLRKLPKLLSDAGAETRAYSREIINSLLAREIVTRSELEHYIATDVIDKCVRNDVSEHSRTIQAGVTSTRSTRDINNTGMTSEATDTLLPHLADSEYRKAKPESIQQVIKRNMRYFL